MEVYFLGTGTSQGIPVIGCTDEVCLSTDSKDKRLRVSIWVVDKDFSVVIDCGPDFRQQMLNSKCDRVDGILFTHEHADHTAGLDDIRPFYFNQGAISIYAQNRVLKNLEKRFDYIFTQDNKYPGAPSVLAFEVEPSKPFYVKNKTIIPIEVLHGKMPILGYRIDNFAYLTDVSFVEESQIEKLKGVKVLVINALRKEPHHSHFNLEEALEFVHLINPEKAYLSHISHHMGLHENVQKELPKNVILAFDNLTITV
ncbi:MBL fold metallo-hydrolase [Flavobacterium croceum]|uniref:Phosphoribosyl 1,2-cyclic phosphate phosphodiesterase n=1 Tax=Flavobacterium croceum DSM 17960 TaxID=1121886 RepID=A0A2S4NAN8_9FLAO|nr:MBL fold metallo-hydrolase [Flavobacterium croceum]POS02758.1 phosphoribosyl 1,2-cyclic phosphate phosphodiesterase [Flavobacterium croceum DSM 17960]